MEIRRERFDSETVTALADALEAELLATYDGDPGSGGLPAASASGLPFCVVLLFMCYSLVRALQADLVSDGGWSLDLSQPVLERAMFHVDNAY